MLVLGLDTTTRHGSAALMRDGAVVAVQTGDAAIAHAARLPGDLLQLLDVQRLRLADIDLFAVASGPGSFTGLRIGIAAMQGLALANGKPLAGVSALDATHHAVGSFISPQASALSAPRVAVWMDAGRGQVFSAVYVSGAAVESALVDKPGDILARWKREASRPDVFAGDGAVSYRELINASRPDAHVIDTVPPLAPSVARLAELHVAIGGPLPPDAIKPVYVRRSDVELARERAAAVKS